MAVDYREQYTPEQLEPFWPNEIIKMMVSVLCTLAVIMFFAVLPVLLEAAGLGHLEHHEEPANPRGATPVGIKPEWYFLATYQYLRLMPTKFLGVSGKTLGVLSQGALVAAAVSVPFWYRKRAGRRPGPVYRIVVTACIGGFVALTIWGGWPEEFVGGQEHLIPFADYFKKATLMFVVTAAALAVFYLLIAQERRAIRRLMDEPESEPGAAKGSGT
jgi:quinol-cytochrome oxidoreductase complex cytochrome b subunit